MTTNLARGWARAGLAIVVCSALALPLEAHAQTTDRALAEELFRQGQALVEAKRIEEACPKFAESQRLDPSTGTLLNLAACHEKQGKLASAWTEYSDVVTLARRDNRPDRVKYAEERLRSIEPKLSRLTVVLPAASDTPGLVIQLDGATLGKPAIGVAIPVDPGEHQLSARAEGKQTWHGKVTVTEGPSTQSISVPLLQAAPAAQPQATATAAKPDAKPGATQRTVAYVLGGAGLAALGVGAAFGVSAISKNSQSNSEGCKDDNHCTPAAAQLREDAQSAGNVSTALFIAGGALVAAGVVVFVTAPKSPAASESAPRASLWVGPGGAALSMRASF